MSISPVMKLALGLVTGRNALSLARSYRGLRAAGAGRKEIWANAAKATAKDAAVTLPKFGALSRGYRQGMIIGADVGPEVFRAARHFGAHVDTSSVIARSAKSATGLATALVVGHVADIGLRTAAKAAGRAAHGRSARHVMTGIGRDLKREALRDAHTLRWAARKSAAVTKKAGAFVQYHTQSGKIALRRNPYFSSISAR